MSEKYIMLPFPEWQKTTSVVNSRHTRNNAILLYPVYTAKDFLTKSHTYSKYTSCTSEFVKIFNNTKSQLICVKVGFKKLGQFFVQCGPNVAPTLLEYSLEKIKIVNVYGWGAV